MKPNETDFISWLISKATIFLVLIFVLVGTLANSVNDEVSKTLTGWNRFVVQLSAFMIIGAISGYCIEVLRVNAYAMCVIGIPLGMGGTQIIIWLRTLWNKSNSPSEFFTSVGSTFSAFWQAYNQIKGKTKL